MKKVSVVVPCYNEEEAIPLFFKEMKKVINKLKKYDFELIFVDDGSKDNTLKIIEKMSKDEKEVEYISFSRNFGKEAAMLAGLSKSNGDYVTVMDVDLQDPPELLEEMLVLIENNDYDCIGTRRVTRKGEPPIRSFFARCFYKIINKMSKVEMVDGARDFRLMTRNMVNSVLELKEKNRYSKGLFSFVGYKTKWLEYENIERVAGVTKWSFWKLFKYAIEGILAFTVSPLVLSYLFSACFFLLSLILFVFVIISSNFSDIHFLIMFISFSFGILLLCLGIVGSYLSKSYIEIKNRPVYIIRKSSFL